MKLIRSIKFFVLPACVALLAMPVWAEIPSASHDCVTGNPETTPSSDFTLLEGGKVVRHESTGLEWQRCPLGMSFSNALCFGTASKTNWQSALQLADSQDGWRLPNIKELFSISELCRVRPAINTQVFPDPRVFFYWSASPWAHRRAYVTSPYDGHVGTNSTDIYGMVRLVRDGQ